MMKSDILSKISIIVVITSLGIVLILFGSLIFDEQYSEEAYNKACVDLGMKKNLYYGLALGDKYCIDNQGTAHEALFQCEGFAWKKECKANLVSVK